MKCIASEDLQYLQSGRAVTQALYHRVAQGGVRREEVVL